jgi:hypothetical protein
MTKYYSRSKGKFIDIANMPDQYVRNAFVKMCSEESHWKKLAEDNFIASVDDLDKNEIMVGSLTKERDDYKKKANDMEMAKMNINREWLDTKDKLKELEMENQHLVQQLEHDETVVSKEVYQAIFDKCQKLEEDYKYVNDRMMMYAEMLNSLSPKGKHYVFSEIPNTDYGWEFVDNLKRFLNKESYKIRVRGQYLDEETKKTEGWRRYTYGQPIEKSKCLRVYVDINKEVD